MHSMGQRSANGPVIEAFSLNYVTIYNYILLNFQNCFKEKKKTVIQKVKKEHGPLPWALSNF